MPGIRSWKGDLPAYSVSLSRNTDSPLSTELDVIRLMYDLTRFVGAKSVSEVGIYKGACSVAFAQALSDNGGGELHCVDILDNDFPTIRAEIEKLGDLVSSYFYHGDSAVIASEGNLPKFDLIFIDADHSYAGVRRDVDKYWPLLKEGGVMVLHDSVMWEGVRRTAKELFESGVKVITLATSGGSGVTVIFGVSR